MKTVFIFPQIQKQGHILLCLLLLWVACTNKQVSHQSNLQDPIAPFLINNIGDTIPTGVPIQAKGIIIPLDSIGEVEIIPFEKPYKVVPISTNIHPVGEPEIIPLPKNPKILIPGKDVPPLDTMIITGTVVPAYQSKPIPASPLRFKDEETINKQYINASNGLKSSYVASMLQDRKGNFWFGTDYGVSRYNGQTLTHFTEKEGVIIQGFHSLLEDQQGNVWLGSLDGIISRYDGQYFTHFKLKSEGSSQSVGYMKEDPEGNLWFVWGKKLYRLRLLDHDESSSSGSEVRAELMVLVDESIQSIREILHDRHGNLWIALLNGELRIWDGHAFAVVYEGWQTNGFGVSSIIEDAAGSIWLGTNRGFCEYVRDSKEDRGKFHFYSITDTFSFENIIAKIIGDTKEGFWGRNPQSHIHFDKQSFTITKASPDELLYQSSFMQVDNNHQLWVLTRQGASRSSIRGFQPFKEIETIFDNPFNPTTASYSFIQDNQHQLWFGTNTDGLIQFNPPRRGEDGSLTYFHSQSNQFRSINVHSISAAMDGSIWFKEGNHLVRFDGKTFNKYPVYQPESSINYWTTKVDSRGKVWIGSNQGLFCFIPSADKSTGQFIHFEESEQLSHPAVNTILEDRNGHIWFGTNGGGATRILPTENEGTPKMLHYTTQEGIVHNRVNKIFEDSRGNLWFGTDGGITLYDGKQFISYSEKEGLSNNMVRIFSEDSQGNIWIACKAGIECIREASISEALKTGFQNHHFLFFGPEDGLKASHFSFNDAFFDQHNRGWWAADEGYTMLDLNTFEFPEDPPQAVGLTHIEVNQAFVNYRGLEDPAYQEELGFGADLAETFDSVAAFFNYPLNLSLPHYLNHLSFHFTAIDWNGPQKIKYSYRLEGSDAAWSPPSADNKADYRNLPPGKHTLQVKAIGAAQTWTDPYEYHFVILPPWWRTWWAYLLYALFALAALYGLYRYQLGRQLAIVDNRRLQELDQVKNRLYTNITHEFRTPLTVIQGMAEKIDQHPDRWLNNGLGMIRRNAHQLLRLVNQMLDLSKLESGKLNLKQIQGDVLPFLYYLIESFHSYAEIRGVQVHVLPEVASLHMDYDPNRLRDVVANLLSNAIKFSPEGGEVYLSIQEKEGSFLFSVKDTGIGILESDLPHIFDRFYQADDSHTRKGEGTGIGLALTQELVELMGGSIEVRSKPEEGSTFTLHLPITQQAILDDRHFAEAHLAEAYGAGEAVSNLPLTDALEQADLPQILIVEDNADVVSYLSSCLEGQYQILVARDGQAGIDLALEQVPDLIVSDVMMPKKDGFELCYALKQDLRSSHIPIILLTAKVDAASRLTGLRKGADAYLAKPFLEEELHLRISNLLQLRKQMQARYAHPAQAEAPQEEEQPMENAFILKFRQVVMDHLDVYNLDVTKLCKEVGMARSPLHKKLKALTGMSTTEFVRYIRLSRASELLRATDLNVSEVAYQTGFQSHNYFSVKFREIFGKTPTEWRGE